MWGESKCSWEAIGTASDAAAQHTGLQRGTSISGVSIHDQDADEFLTLTYTMY